MVRLTGLEVRSADRPDGDIEIVYSGLRPGEKLFEELLIGANTQATEHPRIMRSGEPFLLPWLALGSFASPPSSPSCQSVLRQNRGGTPPMPPERRYNGRHGYEATSFR